MGKLNKEVRAKKQEKQGRAVIIGIIIACIVLCLLFLVLGQSY
jgi:hypothetical protein